jgi:hypothetical protein
MGKRWEPVADGAKPIGLIEKRAVQQALAAQDGMIYPSVELPVKDFMPRAKLRKVRDPDRPRSYQAIWAEKQRAGFRNLSVADYCKMMALLEQDEIVT